MTTSKIKALTEEISKRQYDLRPDPKDKGRRQQIIDKAIKALTQK